MFAKPTNNSQAGPRFFPIRRISKQQQTEGYGLEVQQDDCNSYVASIPGATITVGATVIEPASGWNRERFSKAINELITRFQAGEVSAGLIPRIDRSSRFIPSSMPLLIKTLQLGIPVHFARERLVLTLDDFDAWDKYLEGATKGRSFIKDLQATTFPGQVKAAKEGKMPSGAGRYGLTGYRYDRGTRKFIPIPGLIETVDLILKLALDNKKRWSLNKITDELLSKGKTSATGAPFRRQSVHKVLKHAKAYAGVYTWSGIDIPGLIPPRITLEQAEIITLNLQRNKEHSFGFGRRKWLTGRVTCGLCGRKWLLDASSGRACTCRGADQREYVPACQAPRMSFKVLEDEVWRALVKAWTSPESLISGASQEREVWLDQRKSHDQRVQHVETVLRSLGKRRRLLSFEHEHSGITDDEYLKRLRDILNEEQENTRQMNDLKIFNLRPEPPDPNEVREMLEAFKRDGLPVSDSLAYLMGIMVDLEGRDTFWLAERVPDEAKDSLADQLDFRAIVYPFDQMPGWRIDVRFDLPLKFDPIMVSPSPRRR